MSISAMLTKIGMTEDDYDAIIKSKKIVNRGNTAEIKRDCKSNKLKVYEVRKEKR